MRVFVLNNYDLACVSAEVAAGDKPAHHLYGIDALARRGWTVVLAGEGPRWLRRLNSALRAIRFPIPCGDLGQQWSVWRQARRGDLVYAPCQTQAQALSYLRACDGWPVPIVTVVHHPETPGRLGWLRRPFQRWQLRGTDRAPALSGAVARAVAAAAPGRESDFAVAIPWGPEPNFYAAYPVSEPGHGIIAAGRTGRDWRTLGRAATQVGAAVEIVCLRADVGADFQSFGPTVTVTMAENEADQGYRRLVPRMAQARALAIPLHATGTLAGLTSLADALGIGKPVIMTRHPLIDLDIEAEGIGRWVDPGDEAGWAEALRWFETHPEEAVAMGRRARTLGAGRWSSEAFADAVERVLWAAAGIS